MSSRANRPRPQSTRSRRQRLAAGAVLATTGMLSTYLAAIRPQPTYASPNGTGTGQDSDTGLLANPSLLQPRNGVSCTTTVTNETQLDAAIDAANQATGHVICIDGEIGLSAPLPEITSTVTLAGDDSATDKITVTASPASAVGSLVYADFNNNGSLTVRNLTFEGGRLPNTGRQEGGAINVYEGDLIIEGSTFTNNRATNIGGAVYVGKGNLTVSDSMFDDNRAYVDSGDGYGGAIAAPSGDVSISGTTTFSNNYAEASGGALYAVAGSVTIADSVTFNGNYAGSGYGGALYLWRTTTASITGATFTDNYTDADSGSQGLGGGAIFSRGSLTITDTVFTNNDTKGTNQEGGAIFQRGGSLSVSGSTFENSDAASRGGAIYAINSVSVPLTSFTVTDSTFRTNSAPSGGGAIYANNADVSVSNTTFTNNTSSSGRGGAIYSSADVTILNSSFSGSEANRVGGAIAAGYALSVTDSVFDTNKTYASSSGGGALYSEYGPITVARSTFTNNESVNADGGAIFVQDNAYDTADISVSYSSFSNNRATSGAGGAIYNFGTGGDVSITNSYLGRNTASDSSGAVFVKDGNLALNFSTLYDNTSTNGAESVFVGNPGTLTARGSVVGVGAQTYVDSDLISAGTLDDEYLIVTGDWPSGTPGTGSSDVAAGSLALSAADGDAAGEAGRSPASTSVLVTGAAPNGLGTGVTKDQFDGTLRTGRFTIGARQVTGGSPTPTPTPDGGGGAPAPAPVVTPVPTPTPSPTVEAPVVDPLEPVLDASNPNIPAGGVPAGDAVLLVDGQPAPVTVRPNARRNARSLLIDGANISMRLEGRNAAANPLGLTSGDALIIQSEPTRQSRSLAMSNPPAAQPTVVSSGTGFVPNSQVKLYVLPNIYVGAARTDDQGRFESQLAMPAGVPAGVHTLQANGFAVDGSVRSLSLGVLVKETKTEVRTQRARTTVMFAANSATLTSKAKKQLRALVKKTGKNAVRVAAVGFVQRNDTSANDQSLSRARAEAVAAYLRSRGVSGKYTVRGNGVGGPRSDARKARVTITFEKPAQR